MTLSLGFAAIYAAAIAMSITPDCGCFGDNPLLKATPPQGLVRGLILAALAGLVWAGSLKEAKENTESQQTS
jgi:hypothetical protein